MCTLVILRRPGHDWPLVVAANRDEMADRSWQAPDRHWPDRDHVVAGRDDLAGGTWLGLNDDGVVAGVLNRRGSLGPAADKRSRGELPLDALDHAEARAAAEALAALDPAAYRPFNLIVADAREAFWLAAREGAMAMHMAPLPAGLSMITAHDLNDPESPRMRFHRPRFEAAAPPDPETDNWSDWELLMASRESDPERGPRGGMRVDTDYGFATVSSSLIAVPSVERRFDGVRSHWRFAPGAPGEVAYGLVTLSRG